MRRRPLPPFCAPGARAEPPDLSSLLVRQVLPGTRMESGSQPERGATSPDGAPPADSLQSPAFKRPATPPGSRSAQMSGGFTLSKGRLTVHDEEDTPKRMRLDRNHLEDGRRSSPGFSFRVGPSSDAAGLLPWPARTHAWPAPAVRRCGVWCGGGAAVRCSGSDNPPPVLAQDRPRLLMIRLCQRPCRRRLRPLSRASLPRQHRRRLPSWGPSPRSGRGPCTRCKRGEASRPSLPTSTR